MQTALRRRGVWKVLFNINDLDERSWEGNGEEDTTNFAGGDRFFCARNHLNLRLTPYESNKVESTFHQVSPYPSFVETFCIILLYNIDISRGRKIWYRHIGCCLSIFDLFTSPIMLCFTSSSVKFTAYICWGMESVNEVVINMPPNCKMKV